MKIIKRLLFYLEMRAEEVLAADLGCSHIFRNSLTLTVVGISVSLGDAGKCVWVGEVGVEEEREEEEDSVLIERLEEELEGETEGERRGELPLG